MDFEEIDVTEFKLYVGEKIKTYRKFNKFTQEDLCNKTYISTDYVSKIELGVSNCTILKLVYLCNALKITPNDVLEKYLKQCEDSYIVKQLLGKLLI